MRSIPWVFGTGLLESAYEGCLAFELKMDGIRLLSKLKTAHSYE
ncbi:MAG: GxxExxY protein [Parachlamydiaceae bacterium]